MKTKFIIYSLLFLLMPFSAFAQSATIKGHVHEKSSGEPVMYASVVLYSSGGDIIAGTATDENGDYTLNNVNPGVYLLEVTSVGYADNSLKLTAIEGENVLDFELFESTATLDAVTITGNRRAQRVTETSTSIQVINTKSIETSKATNTYGLLKGVTGVDYMETGMGQQQVNARGYASAFTGGMLTLVDYRSVILPGIGGVFGPAMALNQNDIKQIEVIVGPNSALYGANASQGVVNIITKNPKEYSGHSISVRGGTNSQFGASFRTSLMLGENRKWGYKLSGEYFQGNDFDQTTQLLTAEGSPTGIFTDPDNHIQNVTGTGALYFFPTDNTEISASGGYSNADYVNQSNIGDLQIDDFGFWYAQVRANFGNFFGYGSAFLQANYTGNDAGKTYNLVNVAEGLANPDNTLTKQQLIEQETFIDKSKRYNIEFQNNFDIIETNIFTWGVQYTNTQPNSEGTFLSDGPTGNPIKLNDVGVYLQYENEMVRNFGFFGSARYDYNDVFGGRVSPKIGLAFKPKNHNIRLAYNEAFGSPPIQPAYAATHLFGPVGPLPAGVIGPLPSNSTDGWLRGAFDGFTLLDADGNEIGKIDKLKPSVVKSFELGYKGLIINKVFIDATVYFSKINNFLSSPQRITNPEVLLEAPDGSEIHTGLGWWDLIITPPGQAPVATQIIQAEGFNDEVVFTYFNYGTVKQWGFDIGLTYQITKNWAINGSYSYIEFQEFEDVPDFVLSTPIPNTPSNKARFGVKYSNVKGAYVELAGRWIQSYLFEGAQAYQRGQVPSYAVIDLKGETPFFAKGLVFGISINNLFDNNHIELPGTATLGFLGSAYFTYNFGGNKY